MVDLIPACAHRKQRSKLGGGRQWTSSRLAKRRLTEGAMSATGIVSFAALPVSPNNTSARMQGELSAAPNQVDLGDTAAWTDRPVSSDAQAPVSHTDRGRGCALTHTSRDAGEPRVSRGERRAASPYAEGRVSSGQILLTLARLCDCLVRSGLSAVTPSTTGALPNDSLES